MEEKKWYKSTTIQGGIISLLVFAALIFRVDLDETLITEFVTRLLGLVSVVMVVYGRIKANKVIVK